MMNFTDVDRVLTKAERDLFLRRAAEFLRKNKAPPGFPSNSLEAFEDALKSLTPKQIVEQIRSLSELTKRGAPPEATRKQLRMMIDKDVKENSHVRNS